jgi:site-specific DNA-methyltransferase (adenine-specific)
MSGFDKIANESDYATMGRYPANCVSTDVDAWYSEFFSVTPRELSVKIKHEDRDGDVNGRQIPAKEHHSTKYPLRKAGELGEGEGARRSVVKTCARNSHPTSKPTALMAWLIRLVTPAGGLVLDPFCGSGSTLKAAEINGFRSIGIEKEEEYAHIARLRLGEWEQEDVELYMASGAAVQSTLF